MLTTEIWHDPMSKLDKINDNFVQTPGIRRPAFASPGSFHIVALE